MKFSFATGLICAACLSGCGQSGDTPVRTDPIAHQLDANGVQVMDSLLRIDFGRSRDSAISSMSKLVGQQPENSGQCADGQAQFVDWPDGTRLVFSPSNGFVGWEKQGAATGMRCL